MTHFLLVGLAASERLFAPLVALLSPTAMADNREPWLQHIITPMGNPRFQNVRFAGSAPGGDEWGGVAGVLKWQATYAAHPTQASALINWQDRQAELALEFAAVIAQIGNGTTVAHF